MAIICIEGHRGGGKSTLATKMAAERIKNGINVFCAVGLDMNFDELVKENPETAHRFGRFYQWETFDEMYNVRGGLIIIDEAYRYMDARRWTQFPDRMKLKLAQNRHEEKNGNDTDLLVICQHINQIDVNFRRLCYDVKRVNKVLFNWFRIQHFEYDESGYRAKRKNLGATYFNGKKIFRYFDTKQNVDADYTEISADWKPTWCPPEIANPGGEKLPDNKK